MENKKSKVNEYWELNSLRLYRMIKYSNVILPAFLTLFFSIILPLNWNGNGYTNPLYEFLSIPAHALIYSAQILLGLSAILYVAIRYLKFKLILKMKNEDMAMKLFIFSMVYWAIGIIVNYYLPSSLSCSATIF